MLSRLLYKSKAGHPPYCDVKILEEARALNFLVDVTGFLIRSGSNYLQVIEGPQAEIRGLGDRIKADVRHHDYCEVLHESADGRLFETWSMGYLNMSGQDNWINDRIPELSPASGEALKAQFVQAYALAAHKHERRP